MNHFKLFLEDAAVPVNNVGSGEIQLTPTPSKGKKDVGDKNASDSIAKRKLPDDVNPEEVIKAVDPSNSEELQQKFFRDQQKDKNDLSL